MSIFETRSKNFTYFYRWDYQYLVCQMIMNDETSQYRNWLLLNQSQASQWTEEVADYEATKKLRSTNFLAQKNKDETCNPKKRIPCNWLGVSICMRRMRCFMMSWKKKILRLKKDGQI